MARALPAGLAAKIGASSQTPSIQVTVQDLQTRLNLFASNSIAGRSSILQSSPGKLLRAIVGRAGVSSQCITV